MSAPLTLPQARIPLGWVMVSGQRAPVSIDIEWMRALIGMWQRMGGVYAPSNNELDNGLQFDVRESESAELTKRINDLERLFHISDTSAAMAHVAELLKNTGASITEVEIDLGSTPKKSFHLTVTDPAISPTSKVMVSASGTAATGRGLDDWEWDSADFAAKPAAGYMTLYARFTGHVSGKRKINYMVS